MRFILCLGYSRPHFFLLAIGAEDNINLFWSVFSSPEPSSMKVTVVLPSHQVAISSPEVENRFSNDLVGHQPLKYF